MTIQYTALHLDIHFYFLPQSFYVCPPQIIQENVQGLVDELLKISMVHSILHTPEHMA